MSITFRIDVPPRPKGRHRVGKGGRMFTPAATVAYEKKVSEAAWLAAKKTGIELIDSPVEVTIDLYPTHADVTLERLDENRKSPLRGDVDNYVKAVLDGIQKDKLGRTAREKGEPLLADDRHVVALTARKHPKQ